MKYNSLLVISILAAAAMLPAAVRAAEPATERTPVIARYERLQSATAGSIALTRLVER